MRLRIKYGQTHAITALGDSWKGKRMVECACGIRQEINPQNRHRMTIAPGGEHIGCHYCRENLGQNGQDAENDD